MKLSINSRVAYSSGYGPCTYVFNVEAKQMGAQTIGRESLTVTPGYARDHSESDNAGNRYVRCHLQEGGDLTLEYEAVVDVQSTTAEAASIPEVAPGDLPLSVLPYTYPSRYCQSDRLMRMAQSEFGHLSPGFGRVLAVCDWITDKVDYLSGSTDSQTSAFDTATERMGVCRDFAHLGIAFCRALNIPARFVSVYALDLQPQDFHAIFEAYLGGRWWLFDATRLVPLDSVVRIGSGRDAADVSFATIWGNAVLQEQSVAVSRLDGTGSQWGGAPVSVA